MLQHCVMMWQQLAMKTSLTSREPRVLNETTDRDREEDDDADLEIDVVFNGKSLTVLLKIPELICIIVPSFFGSLCLSGSQSITTECPFPTQMLPDTITWSAKAMPSKKKKTEVWNLLGTIQHTTNRR